MCKNFASHELMEHSAQLLWQKKLLNRIENSDVKYIIDAEFQDFF